MAKTASMKSKLYSSNKINVKKINSNNTFRVINKIFTWPGTDKPSPITVNKNSNNAIKAMPHEAGPTKEQRRCSQLVPKF